MFWSAEGSAGTCGQDTTAAWSGIVKSTSFISLSKSHIPSVKPLVPKMLEWHAQMAGPYRGLRGNENWTWVSRLQLNGPVCQALGCSAWASWVLNTLCCNFPAVVNSTGLLSKLRAGVRSRLPPCLWEHVNLQLGGQCPTLQLFPFPAQEKGVLLCELFSGTIT